MFEDVVHYFLFVFLAIHSPHTQKDIGITATVIAVVVVVVVVVWIVRSIT